MKIIPNYVTSALEYVLVFDVNFLLDYIHILLFNVFDPIETF